MKSDFPLFITLTASIYLLSNKKEEIIKQQIVQASCGQCQFGMTAKKVVIAWCEWMESYLVEGTQLVDDHGDAHAADGFCSARKAEVSGGNYFE
jgi:hypothetical protein